MLADPNRFRRAWGSSGPRLPRGRHGDCCFIVEDIPSESTLISKRRSTMGRGREELSNYNSALYAVYGSSLGLIALMGRKPLFRAVTALAGAGLLFCAAMSRKAQHATARTRSAHLDEA